MIINKQKYLSKIYDKYSDQIYRFLLLRTSSVEVAQDLMSETFLRFVKKVVSLPPPGNGELAVTGWRQEQRIKNERAFLYRISKNLLVDYYRKKGKSIVLEKSIEECDNLQNTIGISSVSEIAASIDIEKDMSGLAKSLTKMQNEYAEIIILRYVEELSFIEIAQIIEKPEGTVRVMLHRGMKKLRKLATNN